MLDEKSLPYGWSLLRFYEVVRSTRLGTAERGSSNGGEVRLLKMGNLTWGGLALDHVERIDRALIASEDYVEHGEILFNTRNTPELVGKSAVWRADNSLVVVDNNINRLKLDERFIPEFACAYMNTGEGKRRIRALAAGSTSVAAIYWKDLATFRLPLPPLAEQRKIAEILRTWDEAIDAASRLIDAKRRRFTWFRTHLFTGQQRLRAFSREWERVQLRDVLREHGTRSTGTEEVFSVSVHKGLVNQIEHLGRSFAASDTSNYNLVRPGDIVYTKSPTGEFPLGIIKRSQVDRNVIVSPLYGVFQPETDALGIILDAYFESPILTANYLRPLVQKGAKNTIAITNKRFLEGSLTLPRDPAEQQAIAEVVTAARSEVAAVERYRDTLQRQKRGLMQKLLTGEWRVNPDGAPPTETLKEMTDAE